MANFALELKLRLDTFRAGIKQAEANLSSLAQSKVGDIEKALLPAVDGMKKLSAASSEAKIALAGIAATAGMALRSIVKEAADDETSLARFRAQFGGISGEAEAMAGRLSVAFGRTDHEIQGVMTQFARLVEPMGLAREESLRMTGEMSQRMFDLSKTTGRSAEEIGTALEGAMMGMGRAANMLGIKLTDLEVKERALAMGFDPAKIDEQELRLVRYNLIVEKTAGAHEKAANMAATFNGEIGKLTASLEMLKADIGKPVVEWLTPMIEALRKGVDGLRSLLGIVPGVQTALGLLAGGGFLAVTSLSAFAAALGFFGGPLMNGGAAIAAFVAKLDAASASLLGVTETAGAGAAAVGGLTTVIAAAGAALMGWGIGKVINWILDLEAATARAVKGIGTWTDSIKAWSAAALATGPGLLYLILQMQKVGTANAELDAATRRLVSTFAAGSAEMNRYQGYLARGVTAWQAANMAANEAQELAWLETHAYQLDVELLDRLIVLRERAAEAAKKHADGMDKTKAAAQRLAEAQDYLQKNEKETADVIKESAAALEQTRKGQIAADIRALETATNGRLEKLRKASDAEMTEVEDLARKKRELLARGVNTPSEYAEFARINKELKDHADKLAETRQGILDNEANYIESSLKLLERDRQAHKDAADRNIAETRREADEMRRLHEQAISELDRQVAAIRERQNAGAATATAFIDRLRQEQLQRHDTQAAAMAALNAEALAALRGAENEQRRQEIIGLTMTEMDRLARSKERQIELEKEANDLAAQAGRAKAEGREDESVRVMAQAVAKMGELNKERQLEADRIRFAAEAQKQLYGAAGEGAKTQADGEARIAELQRMRLQQQEEIATVFEREQTAVSRIGDELARVNAETKTLIDNAKAVELAFIAALKAMLGIPGIQPTAVPAAPAAGGAGAAGTIADQAKAAEAAGEAKGAAIEANRAAQSTASAAVSAAQGAFALAGALRVNLSGLGERIQQLAASVQAWGLQAATILPQISLSIGGILDGQRVFGTSLNSFGGVVLDQFGQVAAGLRSQASRMDELSRQIEAVDMRQAASEWQQAAQGL